MSKKKNKKAKRKEPSVQAAVETPMSDRVREWILALGLGLVVLFRPWIDGITFIERNAWFVWGILLVAVLYLVRPLLGRESMRFHPSAVLLGAFVAGMLLTPPDVISQTLLAVPIYLLYEAGIIMSRIMVP